MKSYILVVLFLILRCTEAAMVHGDGHNGKEGNGNNNKKDDGNHGIGNGNDEGKNKGDNNGNNDSGDKKKKHDGELDYDNLSPSASGQERPYCKGYGACYHKTLICPTECSERKPKQNKKQKGCHINCGSKCEATCKWRKPNCDGCGSLCYDPRFVGGDGIMFYFHGAKDGNFAIVSDDNLQINAHFIGIRPKGRSRDFTWVQALGLMFDTHTFVIAANRFSHGDDNADALSVRWDGGTVNIRRKG